MGDDVLDVETSQDVVGIAGVNGIACVQPRTHDGPVLPINRLFLSLAPLAGKPGRTLVAATYDGGYWTTLRDGTRLKASRRLVPDARSGQWSVKYAKAAFGPGAPWLRVIGHTLEIVPVEVPGPTAGAIRVRVLFRGAPLPGADLYYGDSGMEPERAGTPAYATDQDGIATVPIRKAGSQVLTVTQTVSPSATPTLADEDVYTATFAFRLDEPSVN